MAASKLDTTSRRVLDADGREWPYDELVLATGATAMFPPVDGLGTPEDPASGVTALRDLTDCRRLAELARPGAPIVVLGGGVLGLETARALAACGVRVHVVEASPWLMPRQLDRAASAVLADRLEALGVVVHSWRVASRWLPDSGLRLDDGTVLAADALVVAAGVRPRTDLAADAALAIEHGVLIDDRCTTSDPRIHAIGDCAQHAGGGFGLVAPGWRQAEVVADLLTGTAPNARYTGNLPVTRLKADGIEVTSVGAVPDDAAPKVTIDDRQGGRYATLAVEDDRVTGAICIGLPEAAATLTQLYLDRAPVPKDRLALLMGRVPADSPSESEADAVDRLICHCNGVSRSRIETAWMDGARTRAEIADTTRATTGCGGCVRDLDALLQGLGTR